MSRRVSARGNDLQPQARYSIRGLTPNTEYDLKVTAHNHAGSTTIRYATATLPVNYSGSAGHYGRGNGSGNTLSRVLMGLGIKSILLIYNLDPHLTAIVSLTDTSNQSYDRHQIGASDI